jgi:hypothetical protein
MNERRGDKREVFMKICGSTRYKERNWKRELEEKKERGKEKRGGELRKVSHSF